MNAEDRAIQIVSAAAVCAPALRWKQLEEAAVAHIRAAENDALERAAAKFDETNAQTVAERIRALKHPS